MFHLINNLQKNDVVEVLKIDSINLSLVIININFENDENAYSDKMISKGESEMFFMFK